MDCSIFYIIVFVLVYFYPLFYFAVTMKRRQKKNWQLAIFAQRTIVAVMMLNFCVRYGNRCVHHAIATRSLSLNVFQDIQNRIVISLLFPSSLASSVKPSTY